MPPLNYYTIREDQGEDELHPAMLPLKQEDRDAIRILTLGEPCSHTDETLSLEMHRSSTSEEYIALSYEWGPSDPDDPIILINNRQVQIRKNLHEAIRQIFEHYSRYLRQRGKFECAHPRGATVVDECVLEDRSVSLSSFPGDFYCDPIVIVNGWPWHLEDREVSVSSFPGDSYCDPVVDAGKCGNICGDGPEKDCYEEALCPWTNLEDNCFWAKHDPPRLWIDALCINQNDISEKSFQVGMMGAIFSSAKLVLAWIGLPKDGSDEALGMFSMQYEQLSQFVEKGGLTDSLIATIVSFCERTYWRRVWILQELFLARKYMVMCGPGSIVSESLDMALACLTDSRGIMRTAANEIILSMRLASGSNHCTLKRWLRLCLRANFQATVPHDYIYALLSISSNTPQIDKARIEVDYNKPVAEVYRQLLQSFVGIVEDPTSSPNKVWLLELSRKMGLSDQEGDALLDSEKKRRLTRTFLGSQFRASRGLGE